MIFNENDTSNTIKICLDLDLDNMDKISELETTR